MHRLRVGRASVLCGCVRLAASRDRTFIDEQFLVLGVDPDAEARALTRQLEKNGFFVVRRVRGQNFSALGFSDAQDVPQKVRVITRRGIALALDRAGVDAAVAGRSLRADRRAGARHAGRGRRRLRRDLRARAPRCAGRGVHRGVSRPRLGFRRCGRRRRARAHRQHAGRVARAAVLRVRLRRAGDDAPSATDSRRARPRRPRVAAERAPSRPRPK